MPPVHYRGQEYSEAAAALVRRRATRDAAPRSRITVVLDPTPNATAAALATAEAQATRDAIAATRPRPHALFTREGRAVTTASLRAENERNRARWAAKA